MNGDPASPEAEDPANQDDPQEGSEDSPIFQPPGDDEYDTISYSQGLTQLPQGFVDLTRQLLQRPGAAFASRFTTATGGDGLPLELFEELVGRVARLNRWVSNSVTDGVVGPPRVLGAVPGSLTVHFGVSDEEKAKRLGEEHLFPSVYGARATVRLLAYGADADLLLPATAPLGKRAVQMLLRTFEDSVEDKLTITWLTHEGMSAELTPERAEEGVKTLNVVPPMTSRTEDVIGYLDQPSHEARTVRLELLRGPTHSAAFGPRLEEKVRQAWGKYVACRIRIEEPENPSLPRAPRRRYRLTRIDRIFDALPVDD